MKPFMTSWQQSLKNTGRKEGYDHHFWKPGQGAGRSGHRVITHSHMQPLACY